MACSAQTSSSMTENAQDAFSDGSCGEPLLCQRIVLDFTQNEHLDYEFLESKCIAFWEFVARTPSLQSLETVPDYNLFDKSSSTPSSSYVREKVVSSVEVTAKEKTAVSVLELVENKGLIDRAFEGNLPHSYCSFGIPDYSEVDSIAQDKVYTGNRKRENQLPHEALKKMCYKLDEWDKSHPQRLDPPGDSKTLKHCKKSKRTK